MSAEENKEQTDVEVFNDLHRAAMKNIPNRKTMDAHALSNTALAEAIVNFINLKLEGKSGKQRSTNTRN